MSLARLRERVAHAEADVQAHGGRVAADFRVFGLCWREAWSPPRILAAGLAAGFLAGWARPGRAVGNVQPARWLQLASSLAGLAGSLQAAFAAGEAKVAAEDADSAAVTAAVAAGAAPPAAAAGPDPAAAAPAPVAPASPSDRRYAPDPAWDAPPLPAEAATELSERR